MGPSKGPTPALSRALSVSLDVVSVTPAESPSKSGCVVKKTYNAADLQCEEKKEKMEAKTADNTPSKSFTPVPSRASSVSPDVDSITPTKTPSKSGRVIKKTFKAA